MDPLATLQTLREMLLDHAAEPEIADQDWLDTLNEYLDAYLDWIAKGGFTPIGEHVDRIIFASALLAMAGKRAKEMSNFDWLGGN